MRDHALEIRYIVVVPSWLDRYNQYRIKFVNSLVRARVAFYI